MMDLGDFLYYKIRELYRHESVAKAVGKPFKDYRVFVSLNKDNFGEMFIAKKSYNEKIDEKVLCDVEILENLFSFYNHVLSFGEKHRRLLTFPLHGFKTIQEKYEEILKNAK